jgi:hypothetical protein
MQILAQAEQVVVPVAQIFLTIPSFVQEGLGGDEEAHVCLRSLGLCAWAAGVGQPLRGMEELQD